MYAKFFFGLILAGSAVVFTIQNVAVMELRLFFWTVSMSLSLLMFLMFVAGSLLGWLLHGSLNRKKAIAHENQ